MRATKAGGQVVALLADPFMTSQQEAKIFQFMRGAFPFDWNGDTTLIDVRRDLAEHIAITIDLSAFEEIGIDPSEETYPKVTDHARSTKPSPKGTQDPFAKPTISVHEQVPSDPKFRTGRKWWSEKPEQIARTKTSTAAKLLFFLEQLDSTITIRHGQLVITTQERAEDQCCVRVYDVTPLVTLGSPDRVHEGISNNRSMVDYQSLIDVIFTAINPDTWESMGGPSTIGVYPCRGRQWLVASTPLVTHWKIQALLDKLNQ